MIDWDKPIETENGSPAKVISRDYRTTRYGICMMVQIEELEYSHTASYTLQGDSVGFLPPFTGPKLRNRKTKREGWVNVYEGCWVGTIYSTELQAKANTSSNVEATIKIEWEE